MNKIKVNYLYSSIYQILLIALPIITAPYVTRVLGAGPLGTYTYTYTIANYFVIFVVLGLASYGNRSIALSINATERSKCFNELYSFQITWGMVALVVYVFFVSLFGYNEGLTIYVLQGCYVLSAVFDVSWYFFGKEAFNITVTRNIIVKLLATICIFVFVKDSYDLYLYTVIISGFTLIGNFILWVLALKDTGFHYKSFAKYKIHIKQILVLFIPVLAVSVYASLSKIILGNLAPIEEVTYYEYAYKIISAPLGLITALGIVMLPRMSNLYAKKESQEAERLLNSSFDFVGILALPMCVGIFLVGKNFAVLFYGVDYGTCGVVMSLLAWTVPFIAIGNVIRTQILVPLKKDSIFVTSVSLGAVINIIINIIIIPKYAAVGAAMTTIITEIVVCLYQIICVRRDIQSRNFIKQLLETGVAVLAMAACVYPLQKYLSNSWGSLAMSVITGIIVYGLFILMTKKNVREMAMTLIRRR